MMRGVPAEVRGFDLAAAAYERGRPEYPRAATDHLERELRTRPGELVVDLGAGTGKLTRAMGTWRVRRLAVEPTPAMRGEFRRRLPEVPLVAAVAESIPVRTGVAGAVVVGQAFHWFRQPSARVEIARVLRPEGTLGLIWNIRDENRPWTARLGELVNRATGEVPRTRSGAWRQALIDAPEFGPLEERSFPHAQLADVDTLVDRVLSISGVALQPPERQAAVAAELRQILADEPETAGRAQVELPYTTTVYVARRRSG